MSSKKTLLSVKQQNAQSTERTEAQSLRLILHFHLSLGCIKKKFNRSVLGTLLAKNAMTSRTGDDDPQRQGGRRRRCALRGNAVECVRSLWARRRGVNTGEGLRADLLGYP